MKPNWLQVKWIVQTILIDLTLTPKVAPSSPAGYRLYIQGLDNITGDKTENTVHGEVSLDEDCLFLSWGKNKCSDRSMEVKLPAL